MPSVGEKQRRAILEEVRREFPNDELMQELHYVRRLHQLQTEGMTREEIIAFYNQAVKTSAGSQPNQP